MIEENGWIELNLIRNTEGHEEGEFTYLSVRGNSVMLVNERSMGEVKRFEMEESGVRSYVNDSRDIWTK